jgi:hypothetical protein
VGDVPPLAKLAVDHAGADHFRYEILLGGLADAVVPGNAAVVGESSARSKPT